MPSSTPTSCGECSSRAVYEAHVQLPHRGAPVRRPRSADDVVVRKGTTTRQILGPPEAVQRYERAKRSKSGVVFQAQPKDE